MDTSFTLRIDANGKRWDGNSSPQGDKQQRRRQKLQALLQTLKAGDLDAARLAFTALINFDPTVSADQALSITLKKRQVFHTYGMALNTRGAFDSRTNFVVC